MARSRTGVSGLASTSHNRCEWCDAPALNLRPHHRFGAALIVCSECDKETEPPEERRRELRDGWVYFIQAGENGLVKIGWAYDPVARMESFQTGNHEPLRLVHKIRGTAALEAELHRRLADYRVRGEWFRQEALIRVAVMWDVKQPL